MDQGELGVRPGGGFRLLGARPFIVLAHLALAASACVSGADGSGATEPSVLEHETVAGNGGPENVHGDHLDEDHLHESGDRDVQGSGAASALEESSGHEGHAHSGEPGDTFGHGREIPLEVVLTPLCVGLGGTMSLTVVTEPIASVIYMAEYSDGGGGGPPPYGSGYGGNSGGFAGPDGTYRDTWVVSPQAPVGEAKVTVIAVGQETAERGAIVGFEVVEDAADC